MYASNPPAELRFTELPEFMKYNVSSSLGGNGVTVTRGIQVDKCGPISAGEFPVSFDLLCGENKPEAYEIILSLEGKNAE